MDTKIIAIFAAAIVIAASGTAAFVLLGDKDDDLKQKDVTGRLVIYGNANNDDYLDNDDLWRWRWRRGVNWWSPSGQKTTSTVGPAVVVDGRPGEGGG